MNQELQARVESVGRWFHSIDLGHGVVTPGLRTPAVQQQKLENLRLPKLEGKSVLDIGAWDGFYSFAAEQRGASRVVALDHHAWGLDRSALQHYNERCQKGEVQRQPLDHVPELWRWEDLPGRRGFDLAREALGSKVMPVVADFMTTDLAALGPFDVVLYLGVLYHIEHPLLALQRLRQVTKELAVLETEAVEFRGFREVPLCEFFPFDKPLNDDPTNFWAPNAAALAGMGVTAGFRRVEILSPVPEPSDAPQARYRLTAHLYV
jgi:tRNA (mo5U34)-methyltransferase